MCQNDSFYKFIGVLVRLKSLELGNKSQLAPKSGVMFHNLDLCVVSILSQVQGL